MDWPTVLYVIHRMVSAQQVNLSVSDCWIFSERRHFSLGSLFHIYRTSSQCTISYGCTITILYTYISYDNCATIGNYILWQGLVYGISTSEWKLASFRKYLAVSRKKVCLLHTHHTINISYSMVGQCIASISVLGSIFTLALWLVMHLPTILYIIHTSLRMGS